MPLLHDQLQQVALQPHGEKVDERVYTFVGPSLDARPHQGDWPQDD